MAAGQLTRPDAGGDIRELCIDTLEIRRELVLEKQNGLQSVDEAIAGHASFLNFSTEAYHEVLANIQLLEANASTQGDFVGGSKHSLLFC